MIILLFFSNIEAQQNSMYKKLSRADFLSVHNNFPLNQIKAIDSIVQPKLGYSIMGNNRNSLIIFTNSGHPHSKNIQLYLSDSTTENMQHFDIVDSYHERKLVAIESNELLLIKGEEFEKAVAFLKEKTITSFFYQSENNQPLKEFQTFSLLIFVVKGDISFGIFSKDDVRISYSETDHNLPDLNIKEILFGNF